MSVTIGSDEAVRRAVGKLRGQKWAGRSQWEIIQGGLAGPTDLYLLYRSQGKSPEAALEAVCGRYRYSHPDNIAQMGDRCIRAEAREQAGVQPKAAPKTFHAERLHYCVLRTRLSRREAVDEIARRWRHGPVNRPALEQALAEEEGSISPGRSPADVDVDAIAADATRKLGELEEQRLRLAPAALADSDVLAEFDQVEAEIAACRRRLDLVSLARAAKQEAAG